MPHDQLSLPERVFGSLPTASETMAEFALLRHPISIQRTEGWNEQKTVTESVLPGDAQLMNPWDERQQQLYERDLEEDARLLALRVARVHIGLLGFLNQGRLLGGDPHFEARVKGIFEARLKITANGQRSGYYHEQAIREFLRQINTLVPAAYAFRYHPEFQKEDLERMYAIVYRLEFAKALSPQARERVRVALEETVELERRIEEVLHQGELFSQHDGVDVLYERLMEAWRTYRSLFKFYTDTLENDAWISPSRNASRHAPIGYGQTSEPGLTDYQRFGSKELQVLERRQGRTFALGRERHQHDHETIFFSSGMAAAQAIMLQIREDDERKTPLKKVIGYKPLYFEVDDLLQKTFSHAPKTALEDISQKTPDELAHWIVKERPRALFLSPVSNDRLLQVFDLGKFFECLEKEVQAEPRLWKRHPKITIVIDNTLAGRLQMWQKHIAGLPHSFEVLSYESLVKYAQDGQEFTNAGMVTSFGNYGHQAIESMRNRRGMMPSPTTINRLNEALEPEMIQATMRRQSRNARVFAARLRLDGAGVKHSFLRVVRLPEAKKGESLPMEDVGGLCTLEFDFSFLRSYSEYTRYQDKPQPLFTEQNQRLMYTRNEARHCPKRMIQGFIRLAITLARTAGVDLVDGASFGFRTTRVSVYESAVPPDYPHLSPWQADSGVGEVILPYIRVALGAEPLKQLELLSMVFARTNRLFTRAIEEHRLNDLMQMLEPRVHLHAHFLPEED